ncbi:NADP-dependent malic enzyme [Bartonella sp. CB178]|uniref:NADP-dependent malic enzyme n=1 Tax=Bartonella sp. CB178 TaxID=3112255 RepID=UPI00300E1809
MSKEQKNSFSLHKTELDDAALFYHQHPQPGKLEIQATTPLDNQYDLSLAYSPGVAAPCLAIHKDPNLAAQYTSRSNLVAVVSNGSAVLGLGNIGPLASKPVMEGKAVLFKKFANIDVFDIEVNAPNVEKMIETVSALEPTFGGVNLEDIKAPECFEIEEKLRSKMNIPVFHDDQHGTAIIVSAAVLNALKLAGKKLENAKIVVSGAGAAALACISLLVQLGAKIENIWLSDLEGVVYEGRTTLMDRWKVAYAQKTDARTLSEIIDNADIFLGVSAGGVLKPEYLKKMAPNPLILALANPTPEIMPEKARAARPDAMICTGRSDYPNQVNNVLCFPYIFRGALDVGATEINEQMKIAAVYAISSLAREESSDVAARAYSKEPPIFGPDYLIPSPFDPRLILRIAPAVAKAAMETGVAIRPIKDMEAYHDILNRFVFRSGLTMKPVFAAAKIAKRKRVIYANGNDERILRAAQTVLEEQTAVPLIIGRRNIVEEKLNRLGLKIRPNIDFELIDPESNPHFHDYVKLFLHHTEKRSIPQSVAENIVRTSTTALSALAIIRGEADAVICGLEENFERNFELIEQIIGLDPNVSRFFSISLLVSSNRTIFFTDTYVNEDPSAEEIAEMTALAIKEIKVFGITPKVALLSHSSFGHKNTRNTCKMRRAAEILTKLHPNLDANWEAHGSSLLSKISGNPSSSASNLECAADLFVFPTLDAASIALNLVKNLANALHIGPILIGAAHPAYILTPSVTSRGVVNMTALAVLAANRK